MDKLTLPPLPLPHWPREYFGGVPSGAYTADQVHAYGREAERMGFLRGLEAAAAHAATLWAIDGTRTANEFAAEIRSLAATEQQAGQ